MKAVWFRHPPVVGRDRAGEVVVREWSRSKVLRGEVYFSGEWVPVRRVTCPSCSGDEVTPGPCTRCRGLGEYVEVEA